jgi:F0F1-type ATP synthase membrane subunit c/vacuolar-type H+-ATPase subunit K
MNRAILAALGVLAVASALYGWGNAYVTVATSDPRAYAPYLTKAFVFLGLSQLFLVLIAVRGNRPLRGIAIAGLLANCMPLYHSAIRAPYVFA